MKAYVSACMGEGRASERVYVYKFIPCSGMETLNDEDTSCCWFALASEIAWRDITEEDDDMACEMSDGMVT